MGKNNSKIFAISSYKCISHRCATSWIQAKILVGFPGMCYGRHLTVLQLPKQSKGLKSIWEEFKQILKKHHLIHQINKWAADIWATSIPKLTWQLYHDGNQALPKTCKANLSFAFPPHKASPRMQINRYLQLLLLPAPSPLLSPVERGSKNVLAGMWPSSSSF